MTENELSKIVFDCALRVHKALGPGLLESAYEECLYYELKKSNLKVEKQKPLPLIYEEVKLDVGYRIDIIIEDKFIVEIKAVEALNEVPVTMVSYGGSAHNISLLLPSAYKTKTLQLINKGLFNL